MPPPPPIPAFLHMTKAHPWPRKSGGGSALGLKAGHPLSEPLLQDQTNHSCLGVSSKASPKPQHKEGWVERAPGPFLSTSPPRATDTSA